MAEAVLPPLPDRGPEPADNPVAAEPAVPPAEAAEPEEENEVIALLFPCFASRVSRSLPAFSAAWLDFPYLFGLVSFLCVAPFWLVCCDGVRLHLGRSPSRVGFAFTLLFYCVPYFLAQFCVAVLILFLGSFFLSRYCCALFRLVFSLCSYCFFVVSFPSAVIHTSFWACRCSRRFFIASAHFISALAWLYCFQCRYAPLLRIVIFVIVCLLHFVLWDRTVPIG